MLNYIKVKQKTNMSEHLNKPAPSLNVQETIRTIGKSPDYIEARNIVERQDMAEARRRPTAIRMAATALRGKGPGEHLTLPEHSLNITAQLTTIEDTYITLDRLHRKKARRSERLPHLWKMAEFNHSVKDLVDENPRLQFRDVMGFMLSMNQQIHGRHDDHIFKEGIRKTLNGMRQELAAEQMFGHIEGLEYDYSTTDEDLKGGDFFVSLNGSEYVPIDIKASEFTASRARAEAIENGNDSSHIIWSGAKEEDFNGGFRIPHSVAKENAPRLRREIQATIYHQTRTTRAS